MKTNNFYNMVKIYSMSAYLGFSNTAGLEEDFPIRKWDGEVLPYAGASGSTIRMDHPGYLNLIRNNILSDLTSMNASDAKTRIAHPYGPNGNYGIYNTTPAFVFGSSMAPESVLDYCLGAKINRNSIRTNTVNTVKEHGVVESLITITNITENSIVIREIGLALSSISSSNSSTYYDSNFDNSPFSPVLLERRVLQSPVTIEPNESVSLIIKTGLEEDLEATVVNP